MDVNAVSLASLSNKHNRFPSMWFLHSYVTRMIWDGVLGK